MKQLFLLIFSFLFILPSSADSLGTRPDVSVFGTNTAVKQDAFLPLEQAFQLEKVAETQQSVHLRFIIAQDYYLYKDSITFAVNNTTVTLQAFNLPEGKKKQDEFFGEVEVYYNILDVKIPLLNPHNAAFNLTVKYQGCAEKGLCYPKDTIELAINAGGVDVHSQTVIEDPSNDLFANVSWSNLFYYFLIGLGLAFTPCVYPMLPILMGIVLRGQVGKLRAIILAFIYILFMALAYAAIGVLMGLFGTEFNIQAKLQSHWVLVPFALFFVVFALAMFGVFELRMPAFIANPLNKAADKTRGGSIIGVALLGICSSLVLSPCVTAPFAGILLHITATGDAVVGGLSLFVLGIGMGLPLFIFAAGGKTLLPKVGQWMLIVRNIFGVMLLVVAIGLLARVLPDKMILALWGLLAAAIAIFIGTFELTPKTTLQKLAQLLGVFLITYALSAWVGVWLGNGNPLQPLKVNYTEVQHATVNNWQTIKTKIELDSMLIQAKNAQRKVIIDWYADWCISCKRMDKEIFQAPDVMDRLTTYQLIRLDITESTQEQLALLQQYRLVGPPAVLFFDKNGQEMTAIRIVGEVDQQTFLKHL